jgi:2-polyprenyl-3-methyl-5-hydroxy-6-metoxy-1,4-benzoquinol methylase
VPADNTNPREAWNAGAEAWDDFVESGKDFYRHEVHGPALLDVCGDVSGLRVLDLGCGQGWFSRRLAERGASVVGVELSENQIANARRHESESPAGIEYHLLNAALIAETFEAEGFDLVTACMSIQDMDDAPAVMSGVGVVLKPGGRMAFSVPHPMTDPGGERQLPDPLGRETGPRIWREWERDADGKKLGLKLNHYFDSGVRPMVWNMRRPAYVWETPQWRRTFEQWSTLIADAGLLIRRMWEPRPTADQVRRNPELDDCYRLPFFLVFDCLKA